MERNVHNYEQRTESTMRRIRGETVTSRRGTIDYSRYISQRNREFILRFLDVARARVPTLTRVAFYANKMWVLGQILRDKMDDKAFEDLTKEDIDKLVGICKTISNTRGKQYTENSVHDLLLTIKKATQYRAGYGWHSKKYPPEVEDVRVTVKEANRILPEDILTREEVERMASVARTIRDATFVHVLFESGTRISELLLTRIKDVEFDDYGAIIYVPHGKTGRRKIRLVSSSTILAQWMKTHPAKDNPEAWLWPKKTDMFEKFPARWRYEAARGRLQWMARKASVTKRVNPHAFRHSRNTELASLVTEAVQCKYSGWVIGSKMPRIYVHLSMRDVDDAILRTNGIKKENAVEAASKKCARCEAVNQAVAKLCHRCMLPLDDKTAMEVEERKRGMITKEMEEALLKLLQKEEVRVLLKQTVREQKTSVEAI